jgi:hypothetical protein
MPGGDRGGPDGLGGMTGRGAGYCGGFGMPGFENSAPRSGLRRRFSRYRGAFCYGSGCGRHGYRNVYHATGLPRSARFFGFAAPYQEPDPEIEIRELRNEARVLQSEMDAIQKRLDEIDAGATKTQD